MIYCLNRIETEMQILVVLGQFYICDEHQVIFFL